MKWCTQATPLNSLVSNTENRGDAIVVMDLKNYNSTVVGVLQLQLV
jgi:hypothetical protein